MASAVNENLELRSAFAIDAAQAAESNLADDHRAQALSRGRVLFFLLAPKQAWAAGLQGLLHMDVGPAKLAPPLQDFGVQAVALEQALAHAERVEAPNGLLELAIDPVSLPFRLSDARQPHMGLGDVGALFESLSQLQGLPRGIPRLVEVAFLHRKLAHAQ